MIGDIIGLIVAPEPPVIVALPVSYSPEAIAELIVGKDALLYPEPNELESLKVTLFNAPPSKFNVATAPEPSPLTLG